MTEANCNKTENLINMEIIKQRYITPIAIVIPTVRMENAINISAELAKFIQSEIKNLLENGTTPERVTALAEVVKGFAEVLKND